MFLQSFYHRRRGLTWQDLIDSHVDLEHWGLIFQRKPKSVSGALPCIDRPVCIDIILVTDQVMLVLLVSSHRPGYIGIVL